MCARIALILLALLLGSSISLPKYSYYCLYGDAVLPANHHQLAGILTIRAAKIALILLSVGCSKRDSRYNARNQVYFGLGGIFELRIKRSIWRERTDQRAKNIR